MTYWQWTAEDCFYQLRAVGVELSLGPGGKLKYRAPAHLNMRPMLPVIRKYKPGLIRILREGQAADLSNKGQMR